jgi:hypothetical protein
MAVQDPREIARLRGYSGVSKTAETAVTGDDQKPTQQSRAQNKQSKAPILRYPLKRIDDSSDYLCIKILDYKKIGLNIGASLEEKVVKDQNGKEVLDKDGNNKYTINVKGGEEISGTSDIFKLDIPRANSRYRGEEIKGFIYLPIPQNIQDTTSVTWGEDSLDPLSAFGLSFGADALKDPGGAVRKYFEIGGSALGELVKDPTARDALTAAVAGQAFGALGGNVSTAGLVARATGAVFNPNMELLFQGVNIRSFSFNFNFVARSSREGEEIKKIIRELKKSMTPTKSANTGAEGIFIGAPKVFQLEYRKGNTSHPFLNRFLPMALTNVSVNYTGSNTYATYWDGTPVHMTMQLDFQELNPLYTEDYDTADGQIGVGY